ncbi:fluoride efflux transporter FluC [Kocuria massiliensis]|uniref:fluoride efflux transporter FluC n=1 Tax=Kocuria massiliensis TaxID=1926282 RepID=UPI0022B96A76|nr:CrcB family protein [Kocuria massiliensis]
MTSASKSPRDRASARPLHVRPEFLALAFIGGAVGTALRYGLTLAAPGSGQALGAILVINLVGSAVLAAILGSLSRLGPDTGRRRQARILLCTGVMGGFTTYSTLAVSTFELLASGRPVAGIAYGAVSVILGVGAASLGVLAVNRLVPAVRGEEGERS